MCRSLSPEKLAKCHCTLTPNHVVKVGGGPVSKATGVSFFASGPFPTCYQMSRSSTAEASKSSSLRAATGATNVRKLNTAARAGRFQLKLCRQIERQTRCLALDLVKEKNKLSLCQICLLSSIVHQSRLFSSTPTSTDGSMSNSHFTSWDFSKVCVKSAW